MLPLFRAVLKFCSTNRFLRKKELEEKAKYREQLLEEMRKKLKRHLRVGEILNSAGTTMGENFISLIQEMSLFT